MQTFYLKVFDFIDNAKPTYLGIYFSLFFGAKEVTSDTFNISIGIIWGIGILLGLKKSGRPIANNKIDKWKKREK